MQCQIKIDCEVPTVPMTINREPEQPVIHGRQAYIEQLPADFGIQKLRGAYYVSSASGVAKDYLQKDGSWGMECEQVFDTREAAIDFLRSTASDQLRARGQAVAAAESPPRSSTGVGEAPAKTTSEALTELKAENDDLKRANAGVVAGAEEASETIADLKSENERLRKDLRKLLATASDRIARLERENSKLHSLVPPTIDPLANAQKIIDECLVNDPDFMRLSGCVRQWKIRESELKQRATTAESRIARLERERDEAKLEDSRSKAMFMAFWHVCKQCGMKTWIDDEHGEMGDQFGFIRDQFKSLAAAEARNAERELAWQQRTSAAEARIAELTAEVEKSDQRLEQLERDSGCKARPMVSE